MAAGLVLVVGRTTTSTKSWAKSVVITCLVGHLIIAFVLAEVLVHVKRTDWAQSVITGKIHERPFENVSSSSMVVSHDGDISTLPERHDVLFSKRLEPEYLESYTRFLDFHPGNKEWLRDISAAHLALSQNDDFNNNNNDNRLDEAVVAKVIHDRIVATKHDGGLPTRFLKQDLATGVWYVLGEDEAVQLTKERLAKAATDETIQYLRRKTAEQPEEQQQQQRHWIEDFVKNGKVPLTENQGNDHDDYQVGSRVWVWDTSIKVFERFTENFLFGRWFSRAYSTGLYLILYTENSFVTVTKHSALVPNFVHREQFCYSDKT